jgi:hypothetical protein
MGQTPAVIISCTKAGVELTCILYIIRPLCVSMILRSQVVRQSEAEESLCRCTANQFGEGKRTQLHASEPGWIFERCRGDAHSSPQQCGERTSSCSYRCDARLSGDSVIME